MQSSGTKFVIYSLLNGFIFSFDQRCGFEPNQNVEQSVRYFLKRQKNTSKDVNGTALHDIEKYSFKSFQTNLSFNMPFFFSSDVWVVSVYCKTCCGNGGKVYLSSEDAGVLWCKEQFSFEICYFPSVCMATLEEYRYLKKKWDKTHLCEDHNVRITDLTLDETI